MLLGALFGGWLGSTFGLRLTVVVASSMFVVGGLWLARTPVRLLQSTPLPAAEPTADAIPAD
jgi:hypothetical protein